MNAVDQSRRLASESDFRDFEAAMMTLAAAVCSEDFDPDESNDAAGVATRLAIQCGDPHMIALVLARFSDFVARGLPPPQSMLSELAKVFDLWRASGSMDGASLLAAFGIARSARGRPRASYLARIRDSIIARDVARSIKSLGSLELAVEDVSARRRKLGRRLGGPKSESSVKQAYLRVRRLIKSK